MAARMRQKSIQMRRSVCGYLEDETRAAVEVTNTVSTVLSYNRCSDRYRTFRIPHPHRVKASEGSVYTMSTW